MAYIYTSRIKTGMQEKILGTWRGVYQQVVGGADLASFQRVIWLLSYVSHCPSLIVLCSGSLSHVKYQAIGPMNIHKAIHYWS